MFDDTERSSQLPNDDEAFDLLQDLSSNTTEDIRRQRAHFRLTVKVAITLRPGNASEVLSMKVKGVTGDISQGGCSALLPIPVTVGDIYRIDFDKKAIDLPMTFSRCVRCRLIREDAFEVGFSFFKPLCLPETLAQQPSSTLLG